MEGIVDRIGSYSNKVKDCINIVKKLNKIYSGFGVINLMEGCTLSSLEYLYPHTFSGYSDVNLALEIGEKKVDSNFVFVNSIS